MEESSEAHSEEKKASQDNKKRRLKTPSQVMALEKFYNEHKYPTEEMKSELAEQLGLTEKQISGWFCHRRLKDKRLSRDETCANGRQDRLSGVIQDLGSGLGQDSCGSTKHVDYRHVDPREVESQRLYGHDFPAADLITDNRSHYTERVSGMDDTSSESSSSLQDRFISQTEDPHSMETSRYIIQDGPIAPLSSRGTRNMGYKPSGYLKVKGEIENAAITAVKRQLGRQYQEDGPPLGVEFEPLPPGAFESPIRDPIHEPYYVGNPVLSHSPDISGVKRQTSPSTRYEVHNSKLSSRDSYLQEASGFLQGVNHQEAKPGNQSKQKSTYIGHTSSFPGRHSSLDKYDDSTYNTNRSHKKISKHGVEGMASDSFLNHHGHYGGKLASRQALSSAQEDDDVNHHGHYGGKIARRQALSSAHEDDEISPEIVQRSEYLKFKPSRSTQNYFEAPDVEERGISTMIAQEDKFIGEGKVRKDVKVKMKHVNEMTVAKRVRADFSREENVTSSFAEMLPRKNHTKGSALEMPSSFSEDETAETSSSED
ncbi:Octamer-binding transcription factor [Parasponia andersonii]|uniref:Octamer-binding transcription factor n=1 Tax=Parasponia andersonii TaxID=3476 RepID=A0A2P5DR44_PARAD|nr:Octamer-binding transcription factor [Parasponia andersonii]